MKIYTKTGDAGTTSLVGGTRVSKTHPRVMAYGDLDELISYLGVIRCEVEDDSVLRRIQEYLMQISAHFASDRKVSKVKDLDPDEVIFLEREIDSMSGQLPMQEAFVLPSRPRVSSECHVARTVCRRAERSALMIEDRSQQDDIGLRYINRLSDYLFTLARFLCFKGGCKDDYWLP